MTINKRILQRVMKSDPKTCGRCGDTYRDCECPEGPLKD
jgi:hypothetical protein